MAFAWSGLFVTRLCSLKRSRSVRLVSAKCCFLHLLHWIIYVRFVESQVMRYFICLVSPVLVKVYDIFPWLMYGRVRKPCLELQRNVPAGGLGVLSLFASFARTSRSRRFGERRKATTGTSLKMSVRKRSVDCRKVVS